MNSLFEAIITNLEDPEAPWKGSLSAGLEHPKGWKIVDFWSRPVWPWQSGSRTIYIEKGDLSWKLDEDDSQAIRHAVATRTRRLKALVAQTPDL